MTRCGLQLLAAVLSLPLGSPARAETVTADDVVRLSKRLSPLAIAARAAVSVAEGKRAALGLYPNPSLGWNREHFLGTAAEREEALFLSVPIDLSSRRSTQKVLADESIARLQANALRQQSVAVVRSLSLFYRLAAEKRRLQIRRRTVSQLERAAHVVTRRREEGRASGYEQMRLDVEAQLASSRLAQTRSLAQALNLELSLLLELDPRHVAFSGSLRPDLKIPPSRGKSSVERPSLELARVAGRRASKARDLSRRTWIPLFSVSGGLRMGKETRARYGYVAGVTLALPLFNRGQGFRATANARVQSALARTEAAERLTRVEVARAEQQLTSFRAELLRFGRATRGRVDRLLNAAESGYREGRRSIVELLDAQRAKTAVETRLLELELSSKQSEVALRAATGDFE